MEITGEEEEGVCECSSLQRPARRSTSSYSLSSSSCSRVSARSFRHQCPFACVVWEWRDLYRNSTAQGFLARDLQIVMIAHKIWWDF